MVWLLWSMKESAYKLALQSGERRSLAPKKLACSLDEYSDTMIIGAVFYKKQYETKSLLTPNYIATTAFPSDSKWSNYTQTIVTFPDPTYQTQYRVIREHIKHYVSTLFAVPEQAIQIQKTKVGIPELRIDNSSPIPISISHHGLYGAYVIRS